LFSLILHTYNTKQHIDFKMVCTMPYSYFIFSLHTHVHWKFILCVLLTFNILFFSIFISSFLHLISFGAFKLFLFPLKEFIVCVVKSETNISAVI